MFIASAPDADFFSGTSSFQDIESRLKYGLTFKAWNKTMNSIFLYKKKIISDDFFQKARIWNKKLQ